MSSSVLPSLPYLAVPTQICLSFPVEEKQKEERRSEFSFLSFGKLGVVFLNGFLIVGFGPGGVLEGGGGGCTL